MKSYTIFLDRSQDRFARLECMKDLTPFILFAILCAAVFAAVAGALMFVECWRERRLAQTDAKFEKERFRIGFKNETEPTELAGA
jgi:hypothetical protein